MEKPLHPLAKYRLEAKLTPKQLAKLLNISRGMVCHIESGRRPVTPERALEWEKVIPLTKEVLCPEIFAR